MFRIAPKTCLLYRLGLFSILMLTGDLAVAEPQHGIKQEKVRRFEMRRQQMDDLRARHEAEKIARHQAKMEQRIAGENSQQQILPQTAPAQTASLSSTVQQNQGVIERDLRPNKLNRLTPEERVALRKQIREARREIYLQRTQ